MNEREIELKIKQGNLRVKIIVEVAGFPREHVEKTMELLSNKVSEEKSVDLISSSIRKAKLVDEERKVWSSFLEAEFLVKSFPYLLGVIFDYLPSSVEIIEPEKMMNKTDSLNDLLNDLTAKLHQYAHQIKTLQAQNQILGKELMKFKKHIPKTKKEDKTK